MTIAYIEIMIILFIILFGLGFLIMIELVKLLCWIIKIKFSWNIIKIFFIFFLWGFLIAL